MTVVVAVRVLVFERVVPVTMMVMFGRVEVDRDAEERPGGGDEQDALGVAQRKGDRGPDEGGEREERSGSCGAERPLRPQVKPEAEPVADRAAREQGPGRRGRG